MTCDDALSILLEADPAGLTPATDRGLARHLESCPRCRRAARLVRDGTDALDEWLADAVPPPDVQEILRQAASPGEAAHRRRPPAGPLRRAARLGVPLALAATLAALLLLEGPEERLPGTLARSPAAERAADPGLQLDIPPGRDAAILDTGDPDITVVWFFHGD